MRGIIMDGGSSIRLHPLTLATSKQLVPVYDKPMTYCALSALILVGIREIQAITTSHGQDAFQRLLGDGSWFGVELFYAVQPEPRGPAQAFTIGANFGAGNRRCLALGGNIFHGPGLGAWLRSPTDIDRAVIFGYRVGDPALSLEEKPSAPRSHCAVPGPYFYAGQVVAIAANLAPGARGEYEITDNNRVYLEPGELQVVVPPCGAAWLDTGRSNSLLDAGEYLSELLRDRG